MAGSALRGVNLVGLEGGYGGASGGWSRETGPVAGTHYPVFTPEVVDYFRAKGVRVFRLTFSWDRMLSDLGHDVPDPVPGYTAYFTNFKAVVDYATSRGITVIIEPWQAGPDGGVGGPTWLGTLVGDGPGEVDRYAFADFWHKLAAIFRDNHLVEYGLVNEPHDMSTMSWWTTAQKCVDYIRSAGATSTIYVPGNGYTAASRWTDPAVDAATDTPHRSNAFGWLNVNDGQPLWDPQHDCVAEVHVYLDGNGSGTGQEVVSSTVARTNLAHAIDEARDHHYRVFVGEIGANAKSPNAGEAWRDFVAYVEQPDVSSVCAGYTWWAGGWPQWWPDPRAPHFSVSPTDATTYTGDTKNMELIENDFTP